MLSVLLTDSRMIPAKGPESIFDPQILVNTQDKHQIDTRLGYLRIANPFLSIRPISASSSLARRAERLIPLLR